MPRPRKLPDYVVLKIPVYQPPRSVLELFFDGKTLEMAKEIINYLKENKVLWKDDYREVLGISGPDRVLYFRVMRKMLAHGLIREDKGTYRLSERFAERMENIARLWRFEIGKTEELW